MAEKEKKRVSRYAIKHRAMDSFLAKEGNTYKMWLLGRADGSIKVDYGKEK